MTRHDSGTRSITPLILIVDDELQYQDCLAWVLRESGYETISASDGAEAIELLIAGVRPTAIILDMMMPIMDGAQTLDALRADPAFAALPVIVSSASVRNELMPGALAVLRKPFELPRLLSLLELCGHAAEPASVRASDSSA